MVLYNHKHCTGRSPQPAQTPGSGPWRAPKGGKSAAARYPPPQPGPACWGRWPVPLQSRAWQRDGASDSRRGKKGGDNRAQNEPSPGDHHKLFKSFPPVLPRPAPLPGRAHSSGGEGWRGSNFRLGGPLSDQVWVGKRWSLLKLYELKSWPQTYGDGFRRVTRKRPTTTPTLPPRDGMDSLSCVMSPSVFPLPLLAHAGGLPGRSRAVPSLAPGRGGGAAPSLPTP